jgi:hypothetical protein
LEIGGGSGGRNMAYCSLKNVQIIFDDECDECGCEENGYCPFRFDNSERETFSEDDNDS